MIFFVLAGASLELEAVYSLGLLGVAYLASRVVGKFLGAWLGGFPAEASAHTRRWMGPALLPQAGVAIGMALVASNEFPEYRQLLLSLAISSTVVFEITGPIFTRLAISRVCEVEARARVAAAGATSDPSDQRGDVT
jgi:Kef-type K+ transport system membrane component KefB